MRLMKKALISIPLLGMLLSGCAGGKIASEYDPINKDGINTEPGNFDFDGNFVKPEITIDGEDNDEAWAGPNVSETLSFQNEQNTITVKLLRGERSLFFFFRVTDKYICAKGNNNGDDVSHSDSVEIYIDSLNDGGTAPQTDDYQINLGVHDKTRILVGSGTVWSNWNGLCQYETKINGTLNDNSDIDEGYAVEGMIPWNQIGCTKDSIFGVAFGNVDKKTDDAQEETTWNGLTFDGILVEPQTPNNYITYAGNTFKSRGIIVNDITVKGVVVDNNDQPIQGAEVKVGEKVYTTDAEGEYVIKGYNPAEPLALEVSYTGFITHKYTVHTADMMLANGIFYYNVKLLPGTGDDVVEPNYVFIGETTRKLIHSLQLYSSRHDRMGLSLKVTIDDTKFDKYQQYEFYIDTGSSTRTLTDDNSWCIAIVEDKISFVSSDPKMTVKKHPTNAVELQNYGNYYEMYIPYALLGIDKDATVGFSFGTWDTLIKDWDPMNRDGIFALVEDPSLYIRQTADGTIIEDQTGWAEYYDYANDTNPYVDLGKFSGKSVSYVTFSTITAKVNHTDSQYVYIQFTTNQSEWRREEIIELFIDSGSSSRTKRDGESYILTISTAHGKIQQFHSYSKPEETQLNRDEVTILMDQKHMLVKIPYTTLSPSLVRSTLLGFTFGVFNNVAGDWDGYAYNNVYIDPEKPNLYVRVDENNSLE